MAWGRKPSMGRRRWRKRGKAVIRGLAASAPGPTRYIAKELASVQKKVKTLQKANEIKSVVLSTSLTSQTINATTPYMVLLNYITKGDNISNRDGNDVIAKSIKLRLQLSKAGSLSLYRVMLLCDKHPLGSAPTLSELFTSNTPKITDMYDFQNKNVQSRFKVIYDRVHRIGSVTPVGEYLVMNRKFRLQNAHVSYALGNAGTIADIDKCAYYLVIIANVDITGTSDTSLYYNSAFYFTG